MRTKRTMRMVAVGLVMGVLAGVWVFAAPSLPQGVQVTTASTLILPSCNPVADEWAASTAYLIGDYVNTGGGQYFWCVVAGTSSTNDPTWTGTNDVTDGTCTWRWVNRERRGFRLMATGTNDVYCSYGSAAVLNKGFVLKANGASEHAAGYGSVPVWRGEVYGIVGSVSNSVVIFEE